MITRTLAATALALAALTTAPAAAHAATTATAAVTAATNVASAACSYRQVGNTWRCITPGAYCPKAAHLRYGYAKVTNRKYRCTRYANGQWRWKRV